MAVAEIIGAAIGVLLLVTVAYLLVGGTLSTAETVVTAQKDLTLLNEARLRTDLRISSPLVEANNLNFSVTNNGNEVIGDLPHMDVFSFNAANGYIHYTYDRTGSGAPNTWSVVSFQNDIIHAKEFDPGVTMKIRAISPDGFVPVAVQVTTSNGVSARAVI